MATKPVKFVILDRFMIDTPRIGLPQKYVGIPGRELMLDPENDEVKRWCELKILKKKGPKPKPKPRGSK